MVEDTLGILKTFVYQSKVYHYYSLDAVAGDHLKLRRLPMSIRILLEGVLRHYDGKRVNRQDVKNLAEWKPNAASRDSTPFYPARVIMQDFTGVPVMNDLAGMRAALVRNGGKPEDINVAKTGLSSS